MRMNLFARLTNSRHAKHVLATAIVCATLVALPSCGIPPRRHAEPAQGLPEGYNGSFSTVRTLESNTTDNSAVLGIEEFFNDQILARLVDDALLGNRELKILEEEVQVARAEVIARRGAYLPFA